MDRDTQRRLLKENLRIHDKYKDKLIKERGLDAMDQRSLEFYERKLKEEKDPGVRQMIEGAVSGIQEMSRQKITDQKIEQKISEEVETKVKGLIQKGIIPAPERDAFIKEIEERQKR